MKLSDGYRQLAGIFETLETARYEPEKDFGANITGCFSWYLSPRAVSLLNKRCDPSWLALNKNHQFTCQNQPWGEEGNGVDIKLKV